ncbi:MAG: hypothetical protein Q8N23_26940 [Archangium sp.]|nr:hypothetical protein [Archangium sp.]MDP3156342.1 hypothetical protein [Archangium sp.]MDP3570386.1 hypothetical protein [Archangium sp.]
MPAIDRSSFARSLANGINLNAPGVKQKLEAAGIDVAALDADKDGWIKGSAELAKAFTMNDGFDRNGSSASFNNSGKAGQVFQALVSAAGGKMPTSEGKFATQILSAAADRAAKQSTAYGYDNAPTSPLKGLSGNKNPGVSQPGWLKNNWKCNQFVGDALTQAGVKAPTWAMADGTVHYASAEKWPSFTNLFERITDPSQMKPGDIVVRDYPASGDATAHVEIVTSVEPFKSIGAHRDAAYEAETPSWVEGGTYNPAKRNFEVGGNEVYILRPKAALTP